MTKKVLIDLDNTTVDFVKAMQTLRHPELCPFPQGVPGFYKALEPLDGAIMAVHAIENHPDYEAHFCSSPSMDSRNTFCLTEKAESVIKLFGEKFYHRLHLTFDKSMVIGDYLVDDLEAGRGQESFTGELIVYGQAPFEDWPKILDYLGISEAYRIPLQDDSLTLLPCQPQSHV